MSLFSFVIPTWVKVVGFSLILAAIIGGSAHLGYNYGYDKRDVAAKADVIAQQQADLKAQQQLMADKKALQDKYDGLSQELLDTQQKLQQAKSDVQVKIVKEIHSNPVYQSCVVPPSGVQLLRDQAKQLNSIRAGSSQS
jgi:hypothetical protein